MFGATTNRAESFFQNWTNGTSFHETNRETTVNSTSSTGGTVNAQAFTQQAHTIEVSRDSNTYGSAATTRLLLTSTSYSSSFSRDYSTSRYNTSGSLTSVSTTSFSGGDSGGVTNSNTSQTIVDSAGTGSTVSRRSDYTYLRGTNYTSVTSTDSSVFPYSFTFTGNEEETFTSWLSGMARIETLTSTEDRTLTVPSTVSTTAQSGTGSTSTTVSSLSLDCQFTYSTVATYTTRGPQGWTDDTSSPNSTDYYLSSGGSTSQKTAATTLTETILMSYADTSFHRMVDLYDVDALFAGEMAWLFKFTTPAGSLYTNTSAGFLTDFYSLQTADSFTLSHPRNYVTRSSVPNTIAYLSTTSLSGTNTVTVESYDGLVKPTVTNSSTYYYNSAATATSITSQTSAYLSGTWSTGSSSKTFLSYNLGVSQSFLDYQWTETIEGWVNVWTSSTLTTHFESRVEGVVFTTPSTTRSVGLISTTSQDWYFSLSTYTAVTHSPNTSLAILVNSNTSSSGISGSTASSASSGVVALTYFKAWPVVTITAYQSTNGANKAGRPRMQERIYGAGILGFGDGWTDETSVYPIYNTINSALISGDEFSTTEIINQSWPSAKVLDEAWIINTDSCFTGDFFWTIFLTDLDKAAFSIDSGERTTSASFLATWTKTTLSEGSTITSSKLATYGLSVGDEITGELFTSYYCDTTNEAAAWGAGRPSGHDIKRIQFGGKRGMTGAKTMFAPPGRLTLTLTNFVADTSQSSVYSSTAPFSTTFTRGIAGHGFWEDWMVAYVTIGNSTQGLVNSGAPWKTAMKNAVVNPYSWVTDAVEYT